MGTRLTYAQVSAGYPAIAAQVGADAAAIARRRPRAPAKAALLTVLGERPERIGPVGPRVMASDTIRARRRP